MSNKADYRKVNDFRISDKISVLMDEYNRAIDSIV